MMSSRSERALRLLAAVVADEIWRTEIGTGDETEAFQRLQELFAGLPAGHVPHEMQTRLRGYLVPCWHLFTKSGVTSMAAYKLGRMEEPTWNPPVLTFIIERHGGTVLGSVHAELQEWQVNLETRVAECQTVRRR